MVRERARKSRNVGASRTETVGAAKTETVKEESDYGKYMDDDIPAGAQPGDDPDRDIISYTGLEAGSPPDSMAHELAHSHTETLQFTYKKIDAQGHEKWVDVVSVNWGTHKP
jgi:hypothetical protein